MLLIRCLNMDFCCSHHVRSATRQAVGPVTKMTKTGADSLNMNSSRSCMMHVTAPIQVERTFSLKSHQSTHKALFRCFPRGSLGLHHHPLPAEHDDSQSRAGAAGRPATLAGPRLSGSTCEQRGFPLHNERMDHPVQPGQVRQRSRRSRDTEMLQRWETYSLIIYKMIPFSCDCNFLLFK